MSKGCLPLYRRNRFFRWFLALKAHSLWLLISDFEGFVHLLVLHESTSCFSFLSQSPFNQEVQLVRRLDISFGFVSLGFCIILVGVIDPIGFRVLNFLGVMSSPALRNFVGNDLDSWLDVDALLQVERQFSQIIHDLRDILVENMVFDVAGVPFPNPLIIVLDLFDVGGLDFNLISLFLESIKMVIHNF